MKKIKIAVADDQVLFRKGFVSLLSSYKNIKVVMEAANGRLLLEALEKTTELPDLIFLDIRMPEMDGISALPLIRRVYPDIKVMMLTVLDESRFISHLIGEGASGYLLKDSEPEEVRVAIETIIEKGYYFNDKAIEAMQTQLRHPKKKIPGIATGIDLTGREKEILALICQELTMTEIAEKLFISLRTVEKHRDNLLSKTGARNTAGLVLCAIRHKLVDL